jgi:hypothetical protein
MIRLLRGLALFLLLISVALAQDSTPLQQGVPWIDPNAGSTVSSAPPGAHLSYFGLQTWLRYWRPAIVSG